MTRNFIMPKSAAVILIKYHFFTVLFFCLFSCSKSMPEIIDNGIVSSQTQSKSFNTSAMNVPDTIETSIAAIRAMVFQPATLTQQQLNTVYRTQEYGGGIWKYDSTEINWDNTGLILCTSNSKRFKRIYDQNVNIVWFGAVPNSGDQQVVIQRAINFMPAGKTLWIPDGIFYTTRLYGKSNISIDGYGTLKADPSDAIGWHIVRFENCSNVNIKHIVFDGNMAVVAGSHISGVTLLQIWNCTNVTLDSANFVNNNYLAVATVGSNNLSVTNCSILVTDVGVITQGGNQNVNISNNYINGGTSEGISIWGDASLSVDRNIIVNNNTVVNKSLSSAYHIKNGDSIQIINNTASSCNNGVGTPKTTISNVKIAYNRISDCSLGIGGSFNNCNISNNLITNCTTSGIWIGQQYSSSNNTINSNSITNVNGAGLEEDGIRLMHAVNNIVNGNQIIDDRSTKKMFMGIKVKGSDCSNNVISYNTVSGTVKFDICAQDSAKGTVFQGNSGAIANFGIGSVFY